MKEQILDAVDIVEVIGERVSLTRKGREYVGLCPFHPDTRPSMSISPAKRIFKCWSCGAGGDVIKFVQLSQRVDFREALSILARRAGLSDRFAQTSPRSNAVREQLRRTLQWARSHYQRNLRQSPAGQSALAYAHRRGMDDATIEHFSIGLAADAWDDILRAGQTARVPNDALAAAGLITTNERGKTYDRFRNRLIFPIADGQGRCVAFGGRTLADDPAKYLNSPESALFSKSRILYALDLARETIQHSREVIVVEGYLDAVLLHQHGITNVVATLGTALTDSHVKLLTPLADRIVMCFDSDDAGVRAADRAAETALRQRVDVAVTLLEPGEDPADCVIGRGADAFLSMLHSAIPALEFKWNQTVAAYHGEGRHARREATERFLEFVSTVSASGGIDPIEQGLLVNRLAELLSVPASTVYELLTRTRRTARREGSDATPDTSESSAYEASLRGLPGGLVSAVEELFGLALDDPEVIGSAGEAIAAGCEFCPTWRELHHVFTGLLDDAGGYDRRDVFAACEDVTLCDLLHRSTTRAASLDDPDKAREAAAARIVSEIELLKMDKLQEQLWRSDEREDVRADAYAELLSAGRNRHGVLGVGQRNKAGAPGGNRLTQQPRAGASRIPYQGVSE